MQLSIDDQHNLVAKGGTELLLHQLIKDIPKILLSRIYLSISSTCGEAQHLKPHVFWAHQSHDQPSVQNLKQNKIQDTVDLFVCVSNWQQKNYSHYLDIPEEKLVVIKNAIEPIPFTQKTYSPIKLVYTSTPFRGLDVLLDSFELLNQKNTELHIYSGMSLYGRPQEDAQFEAIYSKARTMKNVFYHGVVSNEEIRNALQEAHIFAYPCTWEETSCVSLIEALSAGCLAVIPDIGALKETASGFAQLYPYTINKDVHTKRFTEHLLEAVANFWNTETQDRLKKQKQFFDANYSWETRKNEWITLINEIIHQK